MKYFRLVWSGIWRKRARAFLLLFQIAAAFTLFGLLQGMSGALEQAIAKQRGDVLYVTSSVNGVSLPLAYRTKIESMPGVLMVNPQNFIPGTYQQRDQQVVVVATDPKIYFAINTYLHVLPAQLDRLVRTRDGVVIGAELARKYSWKTGDRIPLQTPIDRRDGSTTWTFEVVGICEYPGEPDMAKMVIANYDHVEDTRATSKPGTVIRFVVKISDAHAAPAMAELIDKFFANSAIETITTSENESAQARLRSMGDLDFVGRTIIGAAFFALLISVGTVMVLSTRERTSEFAVLKVIGFTEWSVVRLVMAEITVLFLLAAGIGLSIASRLLPLTSDYAGLMISMPDAVIGTGIGCAVLLAVTCGWLPARNVMKLQTAQALARQ